MAILKLQMLNIIKWDRKMISDSYFIQCIINNEENIYLLAIK
jgi:hypothetical protein